jgi:spastin
LQNSPTFNRGGQASTHQKIGSGASRPVQKAGGNYDDKLVEMINTTIVDRSPSVKWDDVGMLLFFVLYSPVKYLLQYY